MNKWQTLWAYLKDIYFKTRETLTENKLRIYLLHKHGFLFKKPKISPCGAKQSVYVSPYSSSVLTVRWEKNNNTHLENGPAIITYGLTSRKVVTETWVIDGKLHRYDGPAFIYHGPLEHEMYYIRGKEVNKMEYLKWINDSGMVLNSLTTEDKILIDIKWAS